MRALIYTRGQGNSLQEKKCRRYAEERGHEIVAVATGDDDISNIIKELKIEILIVSDLTRITRNYGRFLTIEKVLALQGVKIESAVEVKNSISDEVVARFLRNSFRKIENLKSEREEK